MARVFKKEKKATSSVPCATTCPSPLAGEVESEHLNLPVRASGDPMTSESLHLMGGYRAGLKDKAGMGDHEVSTASSTRPRPRG